MRRLARGRAARIMQACASIEPAGFIAYVTPDTVRLKKLYPEQAAEARFAMRGSGVVYLYCNRHGLSRMKTPRVERAHTSRLPS